MTSLEEVLRDWEPVIGLEVHTALTAVRTKAFCRCPQSREGGPNAHVCPVCLGLPGALPVPNRYAVECAVMAGLALGCRIEPRAGFWRKHYFYPDMPRGYQITQGPVAFCMDGSLDVEMPAGSAAQRPDAPGARPDGSYACRVHVRRIHLEEDAAKMVHVGGEEGRIAEARESLLDFDRCGTPLIELVTEPDLRSPEEARRFVEALRRVELALGISDCSLESGSMRCDANVSVRGRSSHDLGEKTELKNLNSLRALHDALAFEVRRQADVLARGGRVEPQTRHWEPTRRVTVALRGKESGADYRTVPDPDLSAFELPDSFVERCRAMLPELPDARRARYEAQMGLRRREADAIASDPGLWGLFEPACQGAPRGLADTVAKVVVNLAPSFSALRPSQVRDVAELLDAGGLTFAQAREVLALVDGTDADARRAAAEHGLLQCTDVARLGSIVDAVLARCPDQVAQWRSGRTKVVGYLVGQCMREAAGSGNPVEFRCLLELRLASG